MVLESPIKLPSVEVKTRPSETMQDQDQDHSSRDYKAKTMQDQKSKTKTSNLQDQDQFFGLHHEISSHGVRAWNG